MGVISIGSNTNSLMAQRNLSHADARVSTALERLSSGTRIHRAADDAAGLAIADSLRSKAVLYRAAVRNLNDSISAVSIMENALGAQQEILNRLSELAEQSANGAYSKIQRGALDREYQALVSEVHRIASAIAAMNFRNTSASSVR